MQYVDAGRVLASFDSMTLDNAAAASGLVGRAAPHAIVNSDIAAGVTSGKYRRVM